MGQTTTRELMEASLRTARRRDGLADFCTDLEVRTKVFEAVTWFPHLQAQVTRCEARGMRGELRGIKVLAWCCAGRCLLQFERGGSRLTLITADDEKPWSRSEYHVAAHMGPMGCQGAEGDCDEILRMLHEATRYGHEIELAADENVGI